MDSVCALGKAGVMERRIAILGMGHVGLPTALGLAELGWEVTGADDDAAKVALLRAGKISFYEPDLEGLLTKHLATRKFTPTEDVPGAVRSASVLFICVGTPQRDNGEADLSQVEAIARTIARNLNGYKLIVEKSTVPAITGHWIRRTIERYRRVRTATTGMDGTSGFRAYARPDPDWSTSLFEVASNPEFLQEGTAVRNFFHPDRVILGVESDEAGEILKDIYRPLNCDILVTNLSTAELIKHAANAFLAAKISFVNVLADVCEAVGADVKKVARGLGLDPRIGPDFLSAGIGFGGYCLPKDLRAFIHLAEEHGVDCSLLRGVEQVNRRRIELFLKKVRQALWVLQGKTIGILGLAFKAGTDDMREAPSIKIIDALINEGARLRLYDPQAMPNTQSLFPEEPGQLTYCLSPYEAACGAHALLLLTEWDEFRQLDLARIHDLMEVPTLVDGRNLFEPDEMRKVGFDYLCMGRENVLASVSSFPRISELAHAASFATSSE